MCGSPKTYTGLGVGAHTFRARATDPVGNRGAAARRDWTISSSASSSASSSSASSSSSATSSSSAATSSSAAAYSTASSSSTASSTASATASTPRRPASARAARRPRCHLRPERRSTSRPSGSDSNPGTARAALADGAEGADTLTAGQRALVRAGTYAEDLDLDRAGSLLAPITRGGLSRRDGRSVTRQASHPLEISSSGAYLRFHGFVLERSPGHLRWQRRHLRPPHRAVRTTRFGCGKDQGVYTAEESHDAQILANWIHHNGEGVSATRATASTSKATTTWSPTT